MTHEKQKKDVFSLLYYYCKPFLKIMVVSPFCRTMFQIQVNYWLPGHQIAIEMWQNLFHHTWCAWPIGYALLSPKAKQRWIQMSGWNSRQLWSTPLTRSCGSLTVPVTENDPWHTKYKLAWEPQPLWKVIQWSESSWRSSNRMEKDMC